MDLEEASNSFKVVVDRESDLESKESVCVNLFLLFSNNRPGVLRVEVA